MITFATTEQCDNATIPKGQQVVAIRIDVIFLLSLGFCFRCNEYLSLISDNVLCWYMGSRHESVLANFERPQSSGQ